MSNYLVVVNEEDQYSVWPEEHVMPEGWRDAGKHGRWEECLQFIEEVWCDMRPRSLRERQSRLGTVTPPAPVCSLPISLVDQLIAGPQEVTILSWPGAPGGDPLKTSPGTCRLRFEGCGRGVEISLELAQTLEQKPDGAASASTGRIRVEGFCVLDTTSLQCVVESLPNCTRGTALVRKKNHSEAMVSINQ
jgi:MbtH protein